jgi:hypothetical protein
MNSQRSGRNLAAGSQSLLKNNEAMDTLVGSALSSALKRGALISMRIFSIRERPSQYPSNRQ